MPPLATPFSAFRSLSRRILPRPQTIPRYQCAIPYRSVNTASSGPASTPPSQAEKKQAEKKQARNKQRSLGSHKPHSPPPAREPKTQTPSYELSITCTPCKHRSKHFISKHGYHFGSVLVTCPTCRNRHVISDHLGIFGDRKITIEDLMQEQGQLVKKGTLSEDGNVEFWADGSMTPRAQAWVPPKQDASKGIPVDEHGEVLPIRGETFKPPPKEE